MRLRWCRCLRLPVLLHANNHPIINNHKSEYEKLGTNSLIKTKLITPYIIQ